MEERDSKEVFEYQIGDKKYLQKALVMGQVKLLTNLLKTINLPKTLDITEVVTAIQGTITEALAIILVEEPVLKESPKELAAYFSKQAIDERAASFEWCIDVDTQLINRVVTDFFACNPVASVLTLIRTLVMGLYTPVSQPEETTESTGLTESASI